MADFVHLHLHTEYSLLDGLSRIKPLIKKAKEQEMKALAITDHGAMYGVVEFYKACKESGIKPLIGMEGYLAKEDHTIKDANKKTNANHLLLLAKNLTGYKNLMKLNSIAQVEGFYYKPRFDKATLKKYSEGLICTSSCPAGEIPELIFAGKLSEAKETIAWYQELFGDDFYLEIQRHEYEKFIPLAKEHTIRQDLEKMREEELLLIKTLKQFNKELGIKMIATNDSHYINQDDAPAQDALVCVSTGATVDQINRLRFIDAPSFHVRTTKEMYDLFPDFPEAVAETVNVAEKCEIELTLGKWFFPKAVDLPEGKTEAEELREQITKRLPERMGTITKEIEDRIAFELDTICGKGYAGYFLIMANFAKWTRSQGIITNTRGSAAGSLVSYVLGITTVDPIKYYLPFERFLNPFRPSPPDIDLDIADNRRIDMIEYITRTFGAEKVAQICTFGRMMSKAAIRDIARVLGYDYNFGDQLSKLVPQGSQGFPMSLERAFEESSELKARYQSDPDAKKVIDLAKKVEGNARHISVHAAAVVVAPEEITNFSPIQREAKGDKIITQYEMHAAEEVGLIKFDVLGITQLSIMNSAVEIIERTHEITLDLEKVPLDDKKTFELLSHGETLGVFQLGGSGMIKWLMELKPERVEDLMAMIALYRPGPMANIPEYIARKRGEKQIDYAHPNMEKFLASSFGILVYQDDLLFTALYIAGYNWEEVDKFRKAVGKKIPEEMAKQHIKFVDGCQSHSGMSKEEAEGLWALFEPFQGYGFNKAHAASYGMVSYRSAYLKANYPVEFMAAMLTADSGDTDKITAGIEEAKRLAITVLPPDINASFIGFAIEDYQGSLDGKAIRFGLSAIKNVGEAAVEAIITERNERGPFKDLSDFLLRVDGKKTNKKVLESLIKVGAMAAFGNRAAVLQHADELKSQIDKYQRSRTQYQGGLFDDTQEELGFSVASILPSIPDLSLDQKLQMEKELLGFYLTDNPIARRLQVISAAVKVQIGNISTSSHYQKVIKVGGFIKQIRVVTTKKNNKQMAFGTLEDATGTIEMVIFPQLFEQTRDCWRAEQIVVLEAKVDLREDALNLVVERVSLASPDGTPLSLDDNRHALLIPRGTSQSQLVKLNTYLKESPGDHELVLMFENGGPSPKVVKVPFAVNWSTELQKNIKDVLAFH